MKAFEMFSLAGKKAFVTGVAGGVGRCAALALAEAGADVAVVDADLELASMAAAEIERLGGRSIAIRCDVTDPGSVDAMARRVVEEFGTIDIAFNNAGIRVNESAETMSFESWERVIDTNLTGVFLTSQAAGRVMIAKGGGSIINAASISGRVASRAQPQCAYNASKAGVIMLTKSLAVEWAQRKVRVNSISPGFIVANDLPDWPLWTRPGEAGSSLGRAGRTDELAAAIVYLAGRGSTFTTGADLVIDGAYACV